MDTLCVEYGVIVDATLVGTWLLMQPYSEPSAAALETGERNGEIYGTATGRNTERDTWDIPNTNT